MELRGTNSSVAAMIEALPWVADGIARDPSQQEAVLHLANVSEHSSAEVFLALLALPWMQDTDTSWQETSVISTIDSIGRENPAAALEIVDMPFLQTLDVQDLNALYGLLALSRGENLAEVLAHPWVAPGITDEKTPVIARLTAIAGTGSPRPDLLPILLNPEQTILLTRTITLDHDVELSVVWPAHGATSARATVVMDLLEDSIRMLEGFMGVPWPRPTTSILVADVPATSDGAGIDAFAIHPSRYNDIEYIVHEAAHWYWWFLPAWVREGAATFLAAVYFSKATGTPLPAPESCPHAANLEALGDGGTKIDRAWICNYTLGHGLLIELYETLGDETFRDAFRRLYTWLQDEALVARCGVATPLGEQGLCYYHAAFVEHLPKHAAITQEIINRHYYGAKR
ncbi:MAG: hypothetical protein OXC99_11800 [Chloroflexi bacterium]|nr:hypothetical protein [Chloroflexota bacterium]